MSIEDFAKKVKEGYAPAAYLHQPPLINTPVQSSGCLKKIICIHYSIHVYKYVYNFVNMGIESKARAF